MGTPQRRARLSISRASGDAAWVEGRAGMLYRDLIPDRQGGRFIASHIRLSEGGPVADWVHYHEVGFQLIYCQRGWIRVVYEGQGAPLVMEPGDCVLQPPLIRHRVLECAPESSVIEVSCPADYQTHADEEVILPDVGQGGSRRATEQRFLWHRAARGAWSPGCVEGVEVFETGVCSATSGVVDVRRLRRVRGDATLDFEHHGELLFLFVLMGDGELRGGSSAGNRLSIGDAVVIPTGEPHAVSPLSSDLQLLEVNVPKLPTV